MEILLIQAKQAPAILLVNQAKNQTVLRVLEQAGKDYNEAARRLGLHPSNLYRLVRSLDLKGEID